MSTSKLHPNGRVKTFNRFIKHDPQIFQATSIDFDSGTYSTITIQLSYIEPLIRRKRSA